MYTNNITTIPYNHITKLLNKFQTRKKQLMNTNINIYFNRQCQKHKLTPKYININTNNKNMTAQKTIIQAQRLWIQNEINQLYSKKNSITLDIYKLHLELTDLLHPITWNNKYNNIENKIRFEKNKKTYTINKKLNTLKQQNENEEQKTKINTLFTLEPLTLSLIHI